MRKALLSILATLICILAFAQATQPCVVKQYNQKEQKTPLSGVEVMVTNAGSTVSDDEGKFTLVFRSLKPGDKVNLVSAKKTGFEIFNSEAVEQWVISRNQTPFSLVLVRKDLLEQLKENLSQKPLDHFRQKYEQAVRQLEQMKEEGRLKDEDYKKRYDELDANYQEELQNLDNYIDRFVRVDLSEVSAEEQRILDMVQEGRMEEALEAYRQLDLIDKLSTEATSYQTLHAAAKRIEEEQTQRKDNIKELCDAVKRQVSTLLLARKKKEAEQILVSLLGTLAPVCSEQPDEFRPQMAWLYLQLGEIVSKSQDKKKYLKSAVGEYSLLASSRYYLPSLARAQYLLGQESGKTDAAGYLREAVNNYTVLCAENDQEYLVPLADAKIALGRELAWYTQDGTPWSMLERDLKYCMELVSYVDAGHYGQHVGAMQKIAWEKRGGMRQAKEYMLSALADYNRAYDRMPGQLENIGEKRDLLLMKIIPALKRLSRLCRDVYELDQAELYYGQVLADYSLLQEHQRISDYYNHEIWETRRELLQVQKHLHSCRRTDSYGQSLKALLLHQVQLEEEPDLPAELEAGQLVFGRDKYLRDETKDVLVDLGMYYMEQGALQKAESCFERVYQDSKFGRYCARFGISGLALAYADRKEWEKSAQLAEKTYTSSHGQETYYFTKGMLLLLQGDEEGAWQMRNYHHRLYDGLKAYPGYYFLLSHAFYQKDPDHYRPAMAAAQTCLGNAFLSHSYSEMGLPYFEDALKNYLLIDEGLQEEDPGKRDSFEDVSMASYNVGIACYNLERCAEAKKYLLDVERRESKKDYVSSRIVQTQRVLYLIYSKEKDEEKTLEYLCKATRGFRLMDTRRDHTLWQKRVALENALKDYCDRLGNKANQERADGHYRKAEEDYARLVGIYEQFDEWLVSKLNLAIVYNKLSYVYAFRKNYAKAIETIDKAIAVRPDIAHFYDSKGEILLMKGDEKGAVEMWRKVLELDPDFLSKYEGGTDFYKQLKERKLIEQ